MTKQYTYQTFKDVFPDFKTFNDKVIVVLENDFTQAPDYLNPTKMVYAPHQLYSRISRQYSRRYIAYTSKEEFIDYFINYTEHILQMIYIKHKAILENALSKLINTDNWGDITTNTGNSSSKSRSTTTEQTGAPIDWNNFASDNAVFNENDINSQEKRSNLIDNLIKVNGVELSTEVSALLHHYNTLFLATEPNVCGYQLGSLKDHIVQMFNGAVILPNGKISIDSVISDLSHIQTNGELYNLVVPNQQYYLTFNYVDLNGKLLSGLKGVFYSSVKNNQFAYLTGIAGRVSLQLEVDKDSPTIPTATLTQLFVAQPYVDPIQTITDGQVATTKYVREN